MIPRTAPRTGWGGVEEVLLVEENPYPQQHQGGLACVQNPSLLPQVARHPALCPLPCLALQGCVASLTLHEAW